MVRIMLSEKRTTSPEKQASKMLYDAGLYNEYWSNEVIRLIMEIDLKAVFNHAPDWMRKYIKGVARMTVEESGGTYDGSVKFLNKCMPIFENYLMWIRKNRPNMNEKEQKQIDKFFNEEASYSEIKKIVDKMYSDLQAESDAELATMEFGNSNHTLVPINSYDEFHHDYGGAVTGDEEDEETFWCHANSKNTYKEWVEDGEYQFFVIEQDGWENIPFTNESDDEYVVYNTGEYGNSLIAILVEKATGDLKRCTLRSNHLVEKGKIADNYYETYAQLSRAVGFNVKRAIREYLNLEDN